MDWIIDTSIIFMEPSNFTSNKPGLKDLCKTKLGEFVQEGSNGHDSSEDAKNCLRLLKSHISKTAPKK